MKGKKRDQGKIRLGRGLAALLGESVKDEDNQKDIGSDLGISDLKMQILPIDIIEPGPFQPRQIMQPEALQELADSIRQHGILQPLLVKEKDTQKGQYQIVAGERRWRAAQLAMIDEVPVRICSFTDKDAMAVALVENLQRTDLNIIEEAEGFSRLLNEFNLTQDELSSALGKSRSHIANIIRLLQLPDEIINYLKNGILTPGHARALLMHPDPVSTAKEIIQDDLTVRQTEALVKNAKAVNKNLHLKKKPIDPEIESLEKDLRGRLGFNVKIQFDGKGGSLKIFYKSLEQFDEILTLLKN